MYISVDVERAYMVVYKAPLYLYTLKKQSFIYFLVRVVIEEKVKNMSEHNNLNWTDFLLCIGMELAFTKNGEYPIREQLIAEKLMKLNGGKL